VSSTNFHQNTLFEKKKKFKISSPSTNNRHNQDLR
jgi:hypothetical protein